MRILRGSLRFVGFFVFFFMFLAIYDFVKGDFLLRSYTGAADIVTKMHVDTAKKAILTEGRQGIVKELLEISNETTTEKIGFPFSVDEPSVDAWGNPLLIRLIQSKSESDAFDFGVYSKGPDCVSNTQGDDADDISSWASVDNAYWRQIRRAVLIEKWVPRLMLAMGFSLLSSLFYMGYRVWQKKELR